MFFPRRTIVATVAIEIAITMLLLGHNSSAQDSAKLAKSMHIQAQAMGQSTQLGQTFGINLIINEFSTADDQKALIEAFNQKKNEGLVNAVTKMPSKGRMSITGTLGYDVNYIRKFDLPDGGKRIRMVTDRPIYFWRSMERQSLD